MELAGTTLFGIYLLEKEEETLQLSKITVLLFFFYLLETEMFGLIICRTH